MSASAAVAPEALHPSLWLASQLARACTPTVDTGHASLSAQLPGGGWPLGTLIDLLLPQPGIGEIRLLAPALGRVAGRRIVMLQPPHAPQALGLAALGVPPSQLIWLRTERTADAMWAAEQVLKSGSCGTLLYWPGGERRDHMRGDNLRRLHLAAQGGDTLFFMMRPMAVAQDASPAPLRMTVRPARGGVEVGFLKRRGPALAETIFLPMEAAPAVRIQPREAAPERIDIARPPLPAIRRQAMAMAR